MIEQTFIQKNKTSLIILAALIATVVSSVVIVNQRLGIYANTIEQHVDTQTELLVSVAQITARNGADEVTAAIVRDCSGSNRVKFDELLGRLDGGLSQMELSEVKRLFGLCADFYANQKLAMAAHLSREIEVLKTLVTQLDVVSLTDQLKNNEISSWESLATYEQTQGEKAADLVQAQKLIIDLLIEGKTASSPEIIAILEGVRETKEAELYANTQSVKLLVQLSQK
jgi:hypothetical protein